MIQTYSKSNLLLLKDLWFNIATNLVDSGAMTIETVYYDGGLGVPNYASPSTTASINALLYVFAPTIDMDINAVSQPWRLVVQLDEESYSIWAVTPTQIIQTPSMFSISKLSTTPIRENGRFSKDNIRDSAALSSTSFFSRKATDSSWSCFDQNEDSALIPLSYILTVGDHGLVLTTWAEGHDKAGDCFNWFVIQRSVDGAGATIDTTLDPLFCAFSPKGGGSSDVNTIDPFGIMKFIVREKDINVPTQVKTAVVPTADSSAWFNPIQQVSTSENGKFIVSFPRGVNTQRYRYDTELDMVAFSSADVIAQSTNVPITLYGQSRVYKALNANHLNNKGMRLLMQIS